MGCEIRCAFPFKEKQNHKIIKYPAKCASDAFRRIDQFILRWTNRPKCIIMKEKR